MTTVGRIKQGDLYLSGEIDERMPLNRDGLVRHFSFDETTEGFTDISGARVLGCANNTTHPWYDWLEANCYEFTNADSLSSITIDQAKGYDLIVFDQYVWSVTSSEMNILKSFVDAGVSCVAVGNDARENIFVKEYQTNTVRGSHDVRVSEDAPIKSSGDLFSGDGSTDIYGGIKTLQNGAVEVYRRTDEDLITGYIYESTSGAVLYFDQEGINMGRKFVHELVLYALNKTRRGFVEEGLTFQQDSIAIEQSTINIAPYDGSLESCEGEHYGDVSLPNSNRTIFSDDWQTATHYNDGICKVMYDITPQGYGKIFRWIHGSVTGWKGITSRHSWSADSTKTYTASIYVRVNGNCNPSAYAFYGDESHRLYFKWEKTPRLHQNEWVRGTLTFSPSTSHSGGVYLYGDTNGEEGSTIDYTFYQIEEKDFGTSFVNGSRNETGRLEIPLGSGSNFTLFHKFIPRKDWATLHNGQSYGKRMWNLYDKNTGRKIWWEDYHSASVTNGTSQPWIGFDEFVASGSGYPWHWHGIDHDVKEGEEYWIAVVKSGSTWTKYLLTGSGQKTIKSNSVTHNHSEVMAFSPTKIELRSDYNWLCRDLSFFNRALSEKEVISLSKGKLFMDKSGDVSNVKVHEYPSVVLIEDEEKSITDQTYRSMGSWSIKESDVSHFVESDNTLGNTVLVGEAYITDASYHPTTFEYTRENNTKGANIYAQSPTSWKVGWNTFYCHDFRYVDEANTPWHDMVRMEIYRSGVAEGVDTSQSIRLRNVRLVKLDYDKTKPKMSNTIDGLLKVIEIKEKQSL